MISVDVTILNFSYFYPHKMLGSNLVVGNLTDSEQIVELAVDNQTESYDNHEIASKYGLESEPSFVFNLFPNDNKKLNRTVNSEIKHEAWYIENPVSKELTKRITLKLGPKAEQDFIIVVRTPNVPKTENMMSLINIGLMTYEHERFGVDMQFEDFLRKSFNGRMKDFLKDRRKAAEEQRMQILLAGVCQIPKLVCYKALTQDDIRGNQSAMD